MLANVVVVVIGLLNTAGRLRWEEGREEAYTVAGKGSVEMT